MQKLLPRLFVNSIEIKDKNDREVTIDIIAEVEGTIRGSISTTWFTNHNYLKYIDIFAKQSTSEEVTLRFISENPFVTPEGLEEFVTTKRIDFSDSIVTRDSSVRSTNIVLIGEKETIYKKFNDEGDLEFSLPALFSFDIPRKELNHAAYFLYASFDLPALRNDFGVENISEESLFKTAKGFVTSEIVFEDGEIASNSFAFLSPDGKQWQSSSVQEEGIWFGIEKDGTKIPLELRLIENNKIKDLRKFNEIKNSIEFLGLFESLNNDPVNILRKSTTYSTPPKSYISDCESSLATNDDLALFFSFNCKDFLLYNSVYGSLFLNLETEEKKEIFDNFRIHEIKLYRRTRTLNSELNNRLGNYTGKTDFLDYNEIPDIVAYASGESGDLLNYQTDKGSVRFSDVFKNNEEHMHFEVTDSSFKKLGNGNFSYSVELSFNDPLLDFINKRLFQFSREISKIEGIKQELEFPGFYDFVRNKATSTYIQSWDRARYKEAQNTINFILKMLALLNSNNSIVFEDLRKNLLKMIMPKTVTLNSVDAVLKFSRQLFDKIKGIGDEVLGNPVDGNTGLSMGSVSRKIGDKLLTSSREFTKTIPRNSYTLTGIDYLGASTTFAQAKVSKGALYSNAELSQRGEESNTNGIAHLSWESFRERSTVEKLKYFSENAASVTIQSPTKTYITNFQLSNGQYSFLSPQRIYIKGRVERDSSQDSPKLFDPTFNGKLFYLIKSLNSETPTTKLDGKNYMKEEQDEFVNILSNFNKYNLSLKITYENSSEQIDVEEENLIKNISNIPSSSESEDSQEDDSIVLFSNVLKAVEIEDYYSTISQKLSKGPSIAFDLTNSNNPLNKYFSKEREISLTDYVSKLPNQVKSLFMDSVGNNAFLKQVWYTEDADLLDVPDNYPTFFFNYNYLAKLEILVGFVGGDVSNPIWETLSQETIDKVSQQKTEKALIRITRYANTILGLNIREELEIPIFNNIFTISLPEIIERAREEEEEEFVNIYSSINLNYTFNSLAKINDGN